MRFLPKGKRVLPGVLLALGLLVSLPAFAQKEAEIRSSGSHTFALNAGTPNARVPVTIVASNTLGSTPGLEGRVRTMTEVARGATIQQRGEIWVQWANLEAGKHYSTTIDYEPGGMAFVHIRATASQTMVWNSGTLIFTDASDYREGSARKVYGEVKANGSLPVWRMILGTALWLSGAGSLLGAWLVGETSGTSEYTLAIPTDQTVTLYYKMTGCTAFRDYNGSFTIPAGLTPGAVYGVDLYGWCGGGGIGNWGRAGQRAVLPAELNTTTRNAYFSDPRVPGFQYVVYGGLAIKGPDDCARGTVQDGYYYHRGVHFLLSGAGCDSTGFGGPGPLNYVRNSLPTLTLVSYAGHANAGGFTTGRSDVLCKVSRICSYPQGTPSMAETPFTPEVTYNAVPYLTYRSGRGTAGGETVYSHALIYALNWYDVRTPENVLHTSPSGLSFPTFSFSLPPYTGTCRVTNKTSSPITIYELTPYMAFWYKPGENKQISFPTVTVPAGGTAQLGRGGLYYLKPDTNDVNFWRSELYNKLSFQDCSPITLYTYGPRDDPETDFLKPGFFGLK